MNDENNQPPAAKMTRREMLAASATAVLATGALITLGRVMPKPAASTAGLAISEFDKDRILFNPTVTLYRDNMSLGNDSNGEPRIEGSTLVVPVKTPYGPDLKEKIKAVGQASGISDAKDRWDTGQRLSGFSETTFVRVEGNGPITYKDGTAAGGKNEIILPDGTSIHTQGTTYIYSKKNLANPKDPLVVKIDPAHAAMFHAHFAGGNVEFDVTGIPSGKLYPSGIQQLSSTLMDARANDITLALSASQLKGMGEQTANQFLAEVIDAISGYDSLGTVQLMERDVSVRLTDKKIPPLVIPAGTHLEDARKKADAWLKQHATDIESGVTHGERLLKKQNIPAAQRQ